MIAFVGMAGLRCYRVQAEGGFSVGTRGLITASLHNSPVKARFCSGEKPDERFPYRGLINLRPQLTRSQVKVAAYCSWLALKGSRYFQNGILPQIPMLSWGLRRRLASS